MGLQPAVGPGELTPGAAADRVLHALRGGEPLVEVLVVSGTAAGRRLLVSDRRVEGTTGDPDLDEQARAQAIAALRVDRPRSVTVEVAGERHVLFLEPHRAPGELVIVGAGHIARPLARLGADLGFVVVVLDDRPEFASRERFPDADRVLRIDMAAPLAATPITPRTHLILVTRGHKYDYEVLRGVMLGDVEPAYIGMVGSRRRVRAAFEQLAGEGVAPERLARVNAPIGLDIGAETPEEIAVAIAAELVLARRGGTGAPLRDRERVVERWIRRGRTDAPGDTPTEP